MFEYAHEMTESTVSKLNREEIHFIGLKCDFRLTSQSLAHSDTSFFFLNSFSLSLILTLVGEVKFTLISY